jgi:hypothetical protein
MITAKQQEKSILKIKQLKAALARDKKFWGGQYHDGYGYRYALPKLYIQLGDYTGGMRYLNWFNKNFPDDAGYPDFLFECSIILFMKGNKRAAEKKVFETFMKNTYLFDRFFEKPITKIDKWEGSNLETAEFAFHDMHYHHKQNNLKAFADWLHEIIHTDRFINFSKEYISIKIKFQHESDTEKRMLLMNEIKCLIAKI